MRMVLLILALYRPKYADHFHKFPQNFDTLPPMALNGHSAEGALLTINDLLLHLAFDNILNENKYFRFKDTEKFTMIIIKLIINTKNEPCFRFPI